MNLFHRIRTFAHTDALIQLFTSLSAVRSLVDSRNLKLVQLFLRCHPLMSQNIDSG